MRKTVIALALVAVALPATAAALLLTGGARDGASEVMTLDPDGRFTIPVTINGEGPFPFIFDTGAQGTVVAPVLADKLDVTIVSNAHVVGTSGNAPAGIFFARSFESALFDRTLEMMVRLPPGSVVRQGVVGMNIFKRTRLEMDFAARRVGVTPSGPAPAGFDAIPAVVRDDLHVIVDAHVDGVKVKAMIDTGARRTLGNLALLRALKIGDDDARLTEDTPIGGATADRTPARKAVIGEIRIGSTAFSTPMLTFADPSVLRIMNLADKPFVILGIDQLKRLKALAIDYPRAEVQMKL